MTNLVIREVEERKKETFFFLLQGENPSALTVLTTTLNGRAFQEEMANRCDACSQPNAIRRCTACKSVRCREIRFLSFISFDY